MNPASILVVEDNVDTLRLMELCLRSHGYTVTCASHGRDAIALIGQREFDIVITDLLMPDVDGIEVILATRKFQPTTALVVSSGGGSFLDGPELMRLGTQLGAHSELPKPFTPAQLLATVQKHCPKKKLAGAA